jgi:hypothetical protein
MEGEGGDGGRWRENILILCRRRRDKEKRKASIKI